uniref:Serine/arginine repetitive matrix protein 1-like n=1 Tax=Cicer arietinum TaxID=3827 RepID=A0A1S3EHH9_CICAR|nr:serine/arginine repetitive matrix protein 1-like [Cicer arietinum]
MARTKQSARKNAFPCTPYSSSSSYESVERSLSPPPRATPPYTSSTSPPSHTSQEILNLNPLSILLPPLYTRPTPNIAQVPPHLRTQNTPRRSMRVQSGIGTSKPLNPKPFYFIISDSETDDSSDSGPPSATTPQNDPTSTSEKEPTHTKPTTPSKSAFSSEPSQSTPPHQKRRLINEIVSPLTKQNEPSSQSKPQTKPMKTKSAMTIAQFLARKKLPNPQKRKTLAPKQNLKHCQPASLEHSSQCSPPQPPEHSPIPERSPIQTPFSPPSHERSPNQECSPAHSVPPPEPFPHTQPSSSIRANRSPTPERSSTSTSYYPDVVRAFYCNAKTFDGKSLIISTIKGVEIKLTPDILASILKLPTEGPSVFGDNWYSALNLRKTEVLSYLFEEDSIRYLSTYLKPLPKVFNNMCQHTLIPHCGSHEYVSNNDALLIHHLLNCKRLNLSHVIIQHMICAATKDYKKNNVPYGMFLTKVFRYFGVSLSSEKSLIKISKFSTKNLSLMRKKFSGQTPAPPHLLQTQTLSRKKTYYTPYSIPIKSS